MLVPEVNHRFFVPQFNSSKGKGKRDRAEVERSPTTVAS